MPARSPLTLTVALGAAMLGLTLTGCADAGPDAGAGAGPSSSASAAPQATATETPAPPAPAPVALSLADTAEAAGCTGYERASEVAPYAAEWGKCTFAGGNVRAYRFATPEDYAAFLDSVSGFGIVEGQLAVAGAFVFAPDDQTQLDAIRAALHV
ncbi:hypothetical protein [Plantibacter sp. YIM 135347]|uniref:hypothetical protein n=1 Tax=Plantibacter sp. YIM 135347 TaxID=3423919 RepID=UPI003D33BECD